MTAARSEGELAIVLHSHMPYIEGFGTWPFGEEWLWEAVATCYLPLLDVLDARPGRVTLSVTPVLGDQLEAPGALDRCATFLREIRPETHRRDIAAAAGPREAAALERFGWDAIHARLGLTKPFYDRFNPAISARDFRLRRGDLSRALDLLAVLRP